MQCFSSEKSRALGCSGGLNGCCATDSLQSSCVPVSRPLQRIARFVAFEARQKSATCEEVRSIDGQETSKVSSISHLLLLGALIVPVWCSLQGGVMLIDDAVQVSETCRRRTRNRLKERSTLLTSRVSAQTCLTLLDPLRIKRGRTSTLLFGHKCTVSRMCNLQGRGLRSSRSNSRSRRSSRRPPRRGYRPRRSSRGSAFARVFASGWVSS